MKTFEIPILLARGDTPEGKRERREQLIGLIGVIRDAEFPRDYSKFERFVDAIRTETIKGDEVQKRWRKQASQKREVPGGSEYRLVCPGPIFLPLLQVELLMEKLRYWEKLTSGLRSHKRVAARNEAVPSVARKLWAEVEQEEAIALAELRNEVSGWAAYKQFSTAVARSSNSKLIKIDPKTRQKRANRKQDLAPRLPKICIWSQPMSQADYVNATRRPRKTIERFLKKIAAKAKFPGAHAADADRYDVAVNLKVLARWINGWERNGRHAAGLAAATIAYTKFNDESFEGKIIQVLVPILERRKLFNQDFNQLVEDHIQLYTPIIDPFSKVMGHTYQTRRDIDPSSYFALNILGL